MNSGIVIRGLVVAGLVGAVMAFAGVVATARADYQWVRTVSTYDSNGPSALSDAQSVAVDLSGNVWATDSRHGNLVKFDGSGNSLGSFPLSYGDGLHSDASGNIWVAGTEFDPPGQHGMYGFVTEFSGSGAVLMQINTGLNNFPSDVATESLRQYLGPVLGIHEFQPGICQV